MERGTFEGRGRGVSLYSIGTLCMRSSVQKRLHRSKCRFIWFMDSMGPRNHVLDGVPDAPMGRGNFGGKGRPL